MTETHAPLRALIEQVVFEMRLPGNRNTCPTYWADRIEDALRDAGAARPVCAKHQTPKRAHYYCLECREAGENVVTVTGRAEEPHSTAPVASPQDELLHPTSQVYFRAGLLACREYMARFVEAESPSIAMSIRANWWPSLGPDFGPPRQLHFGELTDGEFGTPSFRCKTADEVSPTQEALPVALAFLNSQQAASAPSPTAQPSQGIGSPIYRKRLLPLLRGELRLRQEDPELANLLSSAILRITELEATQPSPSLREAPDGRIESHE